MSKRFDKKQKIGRQNMKKAPELGRVNTNYQIMDIRLTTI